MTEHIKYFENLMQSKLEQLPRGIKGGAPKDILDKTVQELDFLKDVLVILKDAKKNISIKHISLPDKDKVVAEGYRIAKKEGYNYRRVLNVHENDVYYSGWLDCFDWIVKENE